jgi:hypothetical protein
VDHSPGARTSSWFLLVAPLLICFGLWRWADYVLVPAQTVRAVAEGRPIGNNSDLYPVWLTAREVLLQGRTPYSAQLTEDIQKGFYGRQLGSGNRAEPKDLQAFVYPLYVVFLVAPTVTLPFSAVAEGFRWVLLICLAATVPLWMYSIGFRAGKLFTASTMVLAVSNFPAVLEARQQNISALILLLLAGAIAATVRPWLSLSGFLLAVSTVKPQLSVLLVLWMLLWAGSDWKERGELVWSFLVTFLSLIAAATVLSPHWMSGFWAATRAYRSYAMAPSVVRATLPPILAFSVMAMLILFVGFVCWKWRNVSAGSMRFAWVLALVVCVTVNFASPAAHYQPLLLPALLVLVASAKTLRGTSFFVRACAKGALACLFWQWGMALALALLSMFEPASKLQSIAELPIYTLLALPILILFAVAGAVLSINNFGREITDSVCL